MKLVRSIALISVLAFVVVACARGDLDHIDGPHSGRDAADTGAEDTHQARDGGVPFDSGADDADVRPPSTDTDRADDGGPIDGGPSDSAHPDSDPGGDADADAACSQANCGDGVCDPNTGDCVQCLTDSDCAGALVCDPAQSSCVECLDDSHCSDGLCHARHPVCVPTCCTETVQDSFSGVSYSHNRFDIGVTGAGEPSIIFGDGDNDTLRYAQTAGGQWLSQDITGGNLGNSADMRLALDSNGNPHVILGRYQALTHYWRTQNGWQSHELLVDPGSVGYVDIAVDAQDNVHMIALLDYGGSILYATQNAQGQRSDEYLTLPPENPPVWVNLDTTSDGRPIASFQIGLDKDAVVAERSAAGSWSYEIPATDVSQVHGMAVGPDDEPVVAYRRETSDGLRLLTRNGQSWTDDLIVADPDHGFTPDVTIDNLGDAHVVYMARGAGDYDNPMYYARFNGSFWEHHQVVGVDRAFYPRIAVDDSRTPHIVVYDPPRDAITYVRLD